MNCDLEWVTVEDVEALWYQFVLETDAAVERAEPVTAEHYEHFAGETLDVWLWCTDGGGYWWCRVCQCRHIID